MTVLDTRLDLDLELELLVAVEPGMFLVLDGPTGAITAPVPIARDGVHFYFLNRCHPGVNCASPGICAGGTADRLLVYNSNGPRFDLALTPPMRIGASDTLHITLLPNGEGRWRTL